MKTKEVFKVGQHNICWVSDQFRAWFSDVEFKPTSVALHSKKLDRPMNNSELLAELKPSEVLLGDILSAMKEGQLLTNGWTNIFYIRDVNGVIRTVNVYWDGVQADVYAFPVGDPGRWDDGDRVFSRNSFGYQSSLDTLTPSHSNPLPPTELERIAVALEKIAEGVGEIIKKGKKK